MQTDQFCRVQNLFGVYELRFSKISWVELRFSRERASDFQKISKFTDLFFFLDRQN